MLTTAMTSELEAVNTLLSAIGESRINTLEVTGMADVSAARAVLDEISREVQSIGWHFNTEDDYPLPRDSAGQIRLPNNTLKCVVTGTSGGDVTQRGIKLYDRTKHTDVFTEDQTCRITLLMSWEEMPQVARHYVMVRASRIFQARLLGSDTQFQFSKEEEYSALTHLQEAEGETGNYNIFTGSNSVTSIMER